jgi:sucrose-6-phosphate hydrolase SacC (GH32 family)
MSLPRVLSLDTAERLRQNPIPELARLRGVPVTTGSLTLNDEARRIDGFTGDRLEVMAEFEMDSAETVELILGDNSDADAVRIRYDGCALDANGTVLPHIVGNDPRRLRLHLFYDKSLMELFINDGLQTVTRVAIPPSPALHLEAAATSGAATLREITAWPLQP